MDEFGLGWGGTNGWMPTMTLLKNYRKQRDILIILFEMVEQRP